MIKINRTRVLFAICTIDSTPWNEIFNEGTLETWLKRIDTTDQVWVVQGSRPNRTKEALNRRIEDLRWNSGKIASYLLAYFLMVTLFPIKSLIPELHEEPPAMSGPVTYFKKLSLKFPETLTSLRWKKISIIDSFLNKTNFDFLVIANPSTYINLPELKKFLRRNEVAFVEKPLYCGMVEHSADSDFVVGSFILLNRIAARVLIKNRMRIPVHTLDDVAFGKFFYDIGISPIGCYSRRVYSIKEIISFSHEEISNVVNFKVKTEGPKRAINDVEVLKKLDSLLFQDCKN